MNTDQHLPQAPGKTGPELMRVAAIVALTEHIENLDATVASGVLGPVDLQAATAVRAQFVDIYTTVAGVPYIPGRAGGTA